MAVTKVKKTAPKKQNVSKDMRDMLAQIVAFDGGNGKASLHWLDSSGKLHRRVIPHARTRVTGTRIKMEWGQTVTVDYADFMGQRFGYGDTIWDLAGEYAIDVFQNSPERYGTYDHISYALILMAEMGLPGGEYDIIVSVPPGLYEAVKQQVVDGFSAGQPYTVDVARKGRKTPASSYDGWWEITLSKDLTPGGQVQPRRYKFRRVIVVLEGWVGYAAYRFDLDGNVIELPGTDGQDMLGGVVEIGDAGFGTYDSPVLRDGQLVEDALGRTTDDTGGIGHRLCQPILDKIMQAVPDARLTLAHIDKYLRDYMTGKTLDGKAVKAQTAEAATVDIRGRRLKLKGVFDASIQNYTEWMWQTKITPAIRRNTDAYLVDGGGWLYALHFIRQWAKDKLLIVGPDDVPHLKQYNYFELNGIGMLAFAAVNIRQHMNEEE